MKLRKVGFELLIDGDEEEKENIENIKKMTHEVPQKNEAKILEYLKSASSESLLLAMPYDVFTKEYIDYDFSNIFTDGFWEWPGILSYYVEKYHYRIDTSFLEYMEKNNWKVSKLSKEELFRLEKDW